MYLLALVKQTVVIVDVEEDDVVASVHPDGEGNALRPAERCECGQSLQSQDRVLREETRVSQTSAPKYSVTVQSLMDACFDIHCRLPVYSYV